MYNMNMSNKNAFAPRKKDSYFDPAYNLGVAWYPEKTAKASLNPCLLYDAVGLFCLASLCAGIRSENSGVWQRPHWFGYKGTISVSLWSLIWKFTFLLNAPTRKNGIYLYLQVPSQATSEIQAVQNLKLPFQHPFLRFHCTHTYTEPKQQIHVAPPAERLTSSSGWSWTLQTLLGLQQCQGKDKALLQRVFTLGPQLFLRQGLTKPCTSYSCSASLLPPLHSPPYTQTQPRPSARPAPGAETREGQVTQLHLDCRLSCFGP